jgi:hypothetical protein
MHTRGRLSKLRSVLGAGIFFRENARLATNQPGGAGKKWPGYEHPGHKSVIALL